LIQSHLSKWQTNKYFLSRTNSSWLRPILRALWPTTICRLLSVIFTALLIMFREKLINLYELPFAKIIILSDSIAEVIINENVEMTLLMVKQYHEFLLSHLVSPFSLLINKVNAYTYDFDAQINLATLKEINAMAVVAYSRSTKISTEYLKSSVPRDKDWNLKIYSNRDEALNWLHLEQEKLTIL